MKDKTLATNLARARANPRELCVQGRCPAPGTVVVMTPSDNGDQLFEALLEVIGEREG